VEVTPGERNKGNEAAFLRKKKQNEKSEDENKKKKVGGEKKKKGEPLKSRLELPNNLPERGGEGGGLAAESLERSTSKRGARTKETKAKMLYSTQKTEGKKRDQRAQRMGGPGKKKKK